MSAERSQTADVEIFGAVYHVRGDQDDDRLRELAQVVDTKMREVAARVSNQDPTRIAILAGLNLADELFQCRERHEGERVEIQERVTEIAGQLGRALRG